jgi:3-dehydroquinate synthase class II
MIANKEQAGTPTCAALILWTSHGWLYRMGERSEGIDVVDTLDWSIIPAENLVAACQGAANGGGSVLLYASSAVKGKTLLRALEVGVDGVILRTDSVAEVCCSRRKSMRTEIQRKTGE